jgi:hypothetical protein
MPSTSASEPADLQEGIEAPGGSPMASGTSNPVRYFGLQVRKARLAAGWTLAEFGQRTGYDPAHLGRPGAALAW